MNETMNYKCPCCGSALAFSGISQKLECASCGNSYDCGDLDAMEMTEEGNHIHFDYNADEFGDSDNLNSYTCKNCGAELMCEETTTATECPYCGSPIVLPERLRSGVKPEKVVPFVVTKDQATGMFNDYFKGKRLLPNVFVNTSNRINEIRKLYVPYWLFRCNAYADIMYNAEKEHKERRGEWEITRTEHYAVRRRGTLAFKDIPVDGSEKLDDRITESLEPYDLTQAIPFQSAVLAGAMADRADVAAETCQKRAEERVVVSTEDVFRSTVKGYTRVNTGRKYIASQDGTVMPALLPVWLINTVKNVKGEEKTYTFAVNGQTGKLTCNVPYDKAKAWGWFGSLFAGLSAVLCGLLFAFGAAKSLWIFLAILLSLIIALIVVSVFKGQLKTAKSQKSAADYVVDGSLNLVLCSDWYLYSTTSKRRVENNSKS